jgi:hypothetical protein
MTGNEKAWLMYKKVAQSCRESSHPRARGDPEMNLSKLDSCFPPATPCVQWRAGRRNDRELPCALLYVLLVMTISFERYECAIALPVSELQTIYLTAVSTDLEINHNF